MEEHTSFKESHPRTVFWLRFTGWVLFGAVLPFCFIAFRFNLFKKISGFSISGWGILAIIILAVFVIRLVKYIRKGFSAKSIFAKQCIDGICHTLIPLIALYGMIEVCVANLQLFLQALGCVILCEAFAIPLNPMPEWVDKCRKEKGEDEMKDAFDYMFERFKRGKKEEK